MQYSVWVSSGHSWDEILGLCRHIESTGWDGIWIPDHFMPPEGGYGQEVEPGQDPELDPVHEGWNLVAALAGLIPRVRLGVLVSGNTYRQPAVLAKMAATIDHISNGRLLLGLGSGWQENEHRRYGIPYPTPLGGGMAGHQARLRRSRGRPGCRRQIERVRRSGVQGGKPHAHRLRPRGLTRQGAPTCAPCAVWILPAATDRFYSSVPRCGRTSSRPPNGPLRRGVDGAERAADRSRIRSQSGMAAGHIGLAENRWH